MVITTSDWKKKMVNKLELLAALCWFFLMCVDIAGLEYINNAESQASGQAFMIMFAGINAVFWLCAAYIDNFFHLHPATKFIFLGTHVIYLIFWFFSSSWLSSEAAFSFSHANTWSYVHSVGIIPGIVMTLILFYKFIHTPCIPSIDARSGNQVIIAHNKCVETTNNQTTEIKQLKGNIADITTKLHEEKENCAVNEEGMQKLIINLKKQLQPQNQPQPQNQNQNQRVSPGPYGYLQNPL